MTDGDASREGRGKGALRLLPLVAYVTYVFVVGTIPMGAPPGGVSDKTAHAIVFGLVVPVALPALGQLAPRWSWARRVGWAVLLASGLGALLEAGQSLLPWRSAELLDWVADTVGGVGAGALSLVAGRWRKAP